MSKSFIRVALCLLTSLLALVSHAAGIATLGTFAVNESGAATYIIPIETPPGTAGMVPSLAFSYNSHAGNGLLGVGWSLSGLSAITRCPRTMAQDDVRGSVNYDLNDRYCLDGQRLMAIAGAYGADGTEYRTERESFARIISYDTAGDGPAFFKVWTKGGQVMEYGNTVDSSIEAVKADSALVSWSTNTVAAWALNKVSDTKGNFYTVTYNEDKINGDYYPAHIDYTGNSITNTPVNNFIQFIYEPRTDMGAVYHAGAISKSASRLLRLEIYNGNISATNLIKYYQLTYEPFLASARSSLASVAECANSKTCLAPISFKWVKGATTSSWQLWNNTTAGSFNIAMCKPIMASDVNGDGLTDLICPYDYGNSTTKTFVQLSQGSNFAPWTSWDGSTAGSFNIAMCKPIMASDVNGDGLTDLICPYDYGNSTTKTFVKLSLGTNFIPWTSWDGSATENVNLAKCKPLLAVDLNRDGLTDLLCNDTTMSPSLLMKVKLGLKNNKFKPWATDLMGAAPWGLGCNAFIAADVAGKGMKDIICPTANNNANATYVKRFMADMESISMVISPLGNPISILHKSLIDLPFIYTKDTTSLYPRQDVQGSFYVVSSVSTSNEVGGTLTTTYKYGGLKAELGTGRGMLGFRWIESKQLETGFTSYTEYSQDWPYLGMIKLSKKTLDGAGNNDLLSQSSATFACIDPATGFAACSLAPGQRYFPYVSQSNGASWNIDGSALPTILTASQYDRWGNLSKMTVSDNQGFSRVTNNTYLDPDLDKWFLGRLSSTTVTSTTPD